MPNWCENTLSIKGTKEQIEMYAHDSKEFDYIKNSFEKINSTWQFSFLHKSTTC